MSLTAEAILLLAQKGMSAFDIAEIAQANAQKVDQTRIGNARRQAEFRARKREDGAENNVTRNVTCHVTGTSLLEDISTTSTSVDNLISERAPRNVTRNAPKKSRRCPADWQPDETVLAAARERGLSDAQVTRELQSLRDYEFPKGRSDWDATARNWMRNARPDPKGRPILAAVPTQTTADIERRRQADAKWRADVERAFSNG